MTALRVETVPVDALREDPRNPRRRDEIALERLQASIRRFGFQQPIVAREDGTIVAGHGRWTAAKNLGLRDVPVVRFTGSEADARAYMLADNRTHELSAWDDKALVDLLRELDREDKLFDAGYAREDLRDLEHALEGERAAPEGEEPDPPPPAVTARGDLWHLGEHRIACDDARLPETWANLCREDDDRAAAVFTDPPYGVSYAAQDGRRVRGDDLRGDDLRDLIAEAFKAAGQRCRRDAAWYVWHAPACRHELRGALAAAGLVELQEIVWVKASPGLGQGHYRAAHEPCAYACRDGEHPPWRGGRDQGTAWRIAITRADAARAVVLGRGLTVLDGQGGALRLSPPPAALERGSRKSRRMALEDGQALLVTAGSGQDTAWQVSREHAPEHPTAKPVELAERALRNSTAPGEIVLDPFLGGGCLLLAAERMGRRCRATDLEPAWIDVAVRRWQRETGREARLGGPAGPTFAELAEQRSAAR